MPYLGRGPGFGIRQRYFYTASADDTSVSGSDNNGITLSFTDTLFVDVFLNGVLLDPNSDYNTTTANTIAGLAALSANDFIEVIVFDSFSVGDAVPASSGGTFSGAVSVNADVTVSGTLNVTGDTAAGDDASIGFTAAEGLILTGQGSTSDITIKNDADSTVMSVATGTVNTVFAGNVTATDSLLVTGSTPTLTIGDAGAEDTKIVFDGNAQDFYVGLDDSADDLIIGKGSTVGTTPAISIDENLVSTFGGAAVGKTDTDTSNTGTVDLDFRANTNFVLTLTGNITSLTASNEVAGQSGFIVFIQDGTGGRTVSLHGDYETSGSGGITLSSAASARDIVPYAVSATGSIILGAVQKAFG